MLKGALKALREGISFQYTKPLLASEVRRILPTAVGVPIELSLYTSAVAATSLKGTFVFLQLFILSLGMRLSLLSLMLFCSSFKLRPLLHLLSLRILTP